MWLTRNEFKWTGIILLVPSIVSGLLLSMFGLFALMDAGGGEDSVNLNCTIVYISAGVAGICLFFYSMWFWINLIANNHNDDFWKEASELKEEKDKFKTKYEALIKIEAKYKTRLINILDKEFELKGKERTLYDKEEKLKAV